MIVLATLLCYLLKWLEWIVRFIYYMTSEIVGTLQLIKSFGDLSMVYTLYVIVILHPYFTICALYYVRQ